MSERAAELPRRLLRIHGTPRRRTLAGLGAVAYLVWWGRPVVLVGFGAYALGRALSDRRCGKRGA